MDRLLRILFWIVMLVGGIVTGFWLDLRLFYRWLTNPVFHTVSFILGLFLFRLVLNSSRNTGRLLARLGRDGDLPRMETNKLVTEGYYACMRHPMHLGLFLFPLALAFIVGSVSFIIIIAPLEIIVMIILIKLVEEPQAVRKFSEAYLQYREQVPMFSLRRKYLRALFANSTLESDSDGK